MKEISVNLQSIFSKSVQLLLKTEDPIIFLKMCSCQLMIYEGKNYIYPRSNTTSINFVDPCFLFVIKGISPSLRLGYCNKLKNGVLSKLCLSFHFNLTINEENAKIGTKFSDILREKFNMWVYINYHNFYNN